MTKRSLKHIPYENGSEEEENDNEESDDENDNGSSGVLNLIPSMHIKIID